MKISLKQLEVFVAVAKTENITHAAKTLYLTQSACSMALSTLESQLGGILFERYGKKLLLNEQGRALFAKAANILAEVQELESLMAGEKEAVLAGHLIIGASTTIGNYLLPKIITKFVTHYPQVQLTMGVDNTEQVIQKLLKFDIDIGFIEGLCHSSKIEMIPWRKDELIVVASPTHPLAKQKKITRQCLLNALWILREPGSGTREKFEKAIDKKMNPFLELSNTEAVKQAVLTGLGLSCLSRTVVYDLLMAKKLVELKTPFLRLTRDFYILRHKEKYTTKVLHHFMDMCGPDL